MADSTIFLQIIGNHPLTAFDETQFLDLLEHSLSLSMDEKKRVLDSTPILSQFQIDELIKVFSEEREEFKKLFPKEPDTIKDLIASQKKNWEDLADLYTSLEKQKVKVSEDEAMIESIRASLQTNSTEEK